MPSPNANKKCIRVYKQEDKYLICDVKRFSDYLAAWHDKDLL